MRRPLETQRPDARANAEDRANLKAERSEVRPSPVAKEAGAGARRVRARKPKEAHCTPGPVDFAKVNRAPLAAFPAVLARILPGGKRVGAWPLSVDAPDNIFVCRFHFPKMASRGITCSPRDSDPKLT